MVGSIVVIGVLIHDPLLHSVCNLKAAQMSVQSYLILELICCEFELGHNAPEATKNICCVKGEGVVDRRWLEKFCLGWKDIKDQPMLAWPKTVDSKTMF